MRRLEVAVKEELQNATERRRTLSTSWRDMVSTSTSQKTREKLEYNLVRTVAEVEILTKLMDVLSGDR